MAVYSFDGEISEDHHLSIPEDVPPGPAKILVIPQPPAPAHWEGLRQLIGEMAEGSHHLRSKEEIDRYLRHERESWE